MVVAAAFSSFALIQTLHLEPTASFLMKRICLLVVKHLHANRGPFPHGGVTLYAAFG